MEKEIYEKLTSKFEGLDHALLEMVVQHLVAINCNENGEQINEVDELVNDMTIQRIINLAVEKEVAARVVVESEKSDKDDELTDKSCEVPDWAVELADSQNVMKSDVDELKVVLEGEKRQRAIAGLIVKLPELMKLPFGRIKMGHMTEEEFKNFYDDVKHDVTSYMTEELQQEVNYKRPFQGPDKSKVSVQDIQEVMDKLYI